MTRVLQRSRLLKIALVVLLALAAAFTVARAVSAVGAPPASSASAAPVAAFIGDSDTQGNGAGRSGARWTSLVSDAEGWREVNFGRASTGYATSSSSEVCGRQICPPYSDLIDQVAAIDPAVVVVAGGQSDWLAWENNPDRTARLIDDLLDSLRQRMPGARIIVVSPLQPPGAQHAGTVDDIAEHVQESAEARGLTYVDLLDPNVLSDGDDVSADRFNPSTLGHRAIADRVLQAIR